MALILCLETATHLCSVALCRDGRVVASRDLSSAGYTHAEKLNVFIDEVLRGAQVAMGQLEAVAVGIGPGSYTGLRIGLSAAKGLCYALGIPIIGVGTLDVLCAQQGIKAGDGATTLWPMIDARRMEVFTQQRGASADQPLRSLVLSPEWVEGLDKSQRHVVFGDGADKAAALFQGQAHVQHVIGIQPRTSGMTSLAEQRFAAAAFDDLAYLTPLYGKEAGVTLAKKH
jgi:tRNA threonylcarbamoyladenosine biosynthesis protein TsaB